MLWVLTLEGLWDRLFLVATWFENPILCRDRFDSSQAWRWKISSCWFSFIIFQGRIQGSLSMFSKLWHLNSFKLWSPEGGYQWPDCSLTLNLSGLIILMSLIKCFRGTCKFQPAFQWRDQPVQHLNLRWERNLVQFSLLKFNV